MALYTAIYLPAILFYNTVISGEQEANADLTGQLQVLFDKHLKDQWDYFFLQCFDWLLLPNQRSHLAYSDVKDTLCG